METVLKRGIPVIPVLVDGAGNLVASDLPESMHGEEKGGREAADVGGGCAERVERVVLAVEAAGAHRLGDMFRAVDAANEMSERAVAPVR